MLLAAQTLYYKGMDTTTLSASFIQQDHDGKHLGLIFLIRANMWMFSSLNSKNKTTSEYPNDGHVTVVGGVCSVCGDSSDPHCAVCLVMSQPREYSVEIKEHVANVGRADEIRVVTVFDFHLANRFNGIIPILMHFKRAIDQDLLVEVFSSDTTRCSIFPASFVQVVSITAFMQRNC